jgi:hypothetical protein
VAADLDGKPRPHNQSYRFSACREGKPRIRSRKVNLGNINHSEGTVEKKARLLNPASRDISSIDSPDTC